MAELMKGHKWRDKKSKMTYPAWAEVKTDEIRCRVVVTPQGPEWPVTFLSFAEKPLHNLERFAVWFRELAQATGIMEYDTGFHATSFDNTYRWVRSSKGLKDDIDQSAPMFILFDLPEDSREFSHRAAARQNASALALGMGFPIHVPQGWWVKSEADVDERFIAVRAAKLEGLMVKTVDHLYERGKRTNGWLKVKPEDDADGKIIAINRAIAEDGTPHDRAGSVTVELEDGSIAQPSGLDHILAADIWQNQEKYIGQWVEFVYMERDRQGGYRHPSFRRLREEKQ